MATAIEPTGREVHEKALAWPDRARAARVSDQASYAAAGELLLGIKDLRREIDRTFDPHIANAFKAHRDLCSEKKRAETPLAEAERILKDALVVYDQEQRRIAAEEERRRQEEARAREQQAALERAAAMEQEGQEFGDAALVAEAQQVIDDAIHAPAPAVAPVLPQTPKVAGVSMRRVWNFRITNPDLVPRQYTAINESKIRVVVRSLGRDANIPGVEVYEEQVVAAGRR